MALFYRDFAFEVTPLSAALAVKIIEHGHAVAVITPLSATLAAKIIEHGHAVAVITPISAEKTG
jgi:antitoxin (DNA-binding transcriptional repressor) of toxin-antitoxin stability system